MEAEPVYISTSERGVATAGIYKLWREECLNNSSLLIYIFQLFKITILSTVHCFTMCEMYFSYVYANLFIY